MEEEKEVKSPDAEAVPEAAEPAEQIPEVPEKEEAKTIAEEHEEYVNNLKEKRGRLVMAGLVLTVVLSVVALGVAGIFQLTQWWTKVCPTDPRVNIRAPVLWNEIVAEKVAPQTLGVPDKLRAETALKTAASPTTETPEQQEEEKK